MELECVADFLELKAVAVQAKSMFIGEMPQDCHEGLLLLDRYSGTPIDANLPRYRNTGFRIATRSANRQTCMDLARSATAALTIMSDTPMLDILVKQMIPQNDPRPYRRGAGNYWEAEVDFDAVYVIDRPNLRL